MTKSKQVSITLTSGEWDIIESKLKNGKPFLLELTSHIKKETLKVKNKLKDNPKEIACIGGEKLEKRPSIPIYIIDDINHIATSLNVSQSTVINRLIINPLLSTCTQ